MPQPTSTLIGSTGFVGSTLDALRPFEAAFHSPNIGEIRGTRSGLTVCAGLPAAKYLANRDPQADWENVSSLAEHLSHAESDRFVLISSVDVYQPPRGISEIDTPRLDGAEAYGRNRAWFELFVRATYPRAQILRLPGLFAPRLRKNLIFDLLEGREEQWSNVNADSEFQFFDVESLWDLIDSVAQLDLGVVNVATEPVRAQQVADLFGVDLSRDPAIVKYDMQTDHAQAFGGSGRYLVSADDQLAGIERLRDGWERTI